MILHANTTRSASAPGYTGLPEPSLLLLKEDGLQPVEYGT